MLSGNYLITFLTLNKNDSGISSANIILGFPLMFLFFHNNVFGFGACQVPKRYQVFTQVILTTFGIHMSFVFLLIHINHIKKFPFKSP